LKLIEELRARLIDQIDLTKDISDEELQEMITSMVTDHCNGRRVSLKQKMKMSRQLFHSIRGLDILDDIMEEDKEITEIMVNGYDKIFIEKKGRLHQYEGQFSSPEKLGDVVQTIAANANKRVNEASPILDTRLKDGSRVNIVMEPIAVRGPVVTIRRFPEKGMGIADMILTETMTQEAADFLEEAVCIGLNIFISGGTGSGKTTMLNALSNFIPYGERVITIEDSAELRLDRVCNLVSLECRQANTEGENAVTIRDLIRTSLRMRPDRIVVGEVRGGEALDMLQAMNTGHDGSLSTGHGNSPADMLSRLEVMTLMAGEELPISAIRGQIASALDIMVHLGRMPDGSRRVLNISQVQGVENGEIVMEPLFEYGEDDPSEADTSRNWKREITAGYGPAGKRPGHLRRTQIPFRLRKPINGFSCGYYDYDHREVFS